MLLTRLCPVMYATPRMLKLLLFCLWLSRMPVTTTVAEGSFRIMKGLLTADRRGMSHDTQIGYLLAMVNGDVNHRIPQWAFV